jgi:hypothetical protein
MLSQAVRISAAGRRARIFEGRTETLDPFNAPIAQRSALSAYLDRKPPRSPAAIEINPSTDGPAILRRVLGEDDHRRAIERDRKRRWRARRSPDQVDRDRALDREAARRRRAGRRSASA